MTIQTFTRKKTHTRTRILFTLWTPKISQQIPSRAKGGKTHCKTPIQYFKEDDLSPPQTNIINDVTLIQI